MTHSLTLGSLLLTETEPDADHGFVLNILAEGVGFGVAKGVREVITSLLADSDLTRITRYGNREVTFKVEITGPDLGSLAHGEAALRGQVGIGNTLTWQAPDVLSVPTVFDVITSEMEQEFNDLDELNHCRVFAVTLTCAASARSDNLVTIAALPAPAPVPTTVTINNADTITNWAGVATPWGGEASTFAATDQGSFLRVASAISRTDPISAFAARLTTPAVSLASTPYIVVEAKVAVDAPGYPYGLVFRATLGGTPTVLSVVQARATGSGTTLYVLNTGGGSLTSLTIELTFSSPTNGFFQIDVHDISRTDTIPQTSTRQITRIIEVGGTERTPASIHVKPADGVTPLTHALVHTCPEDQSGYSPPLRPFRVGGQTPVASAPAFSGSYESIRDTGVTFDTPTSVLPEGGYLLVAYLRAAAAGTYQVAWSTSTIFPGGTREEGFTNDVESITFPDDGWHIVSLAELSLPSVRTQAGKVRTIIQVPGAGTQVYLDEAWLFRADDDCALTVVESEYPHLWLDSPDVSSPVPRVSVGDGGLTRVHPGKGLLAMGTHELSPQGTAVFAATLAASPQVEATFYLRWHSNAAS